MKRILSEETEWGMKVFDSLAFPTLILNPDRTIISANKVFLDRIGLRADRVVGRTCREIFNRFFYDPGLPCSEEDCPFTHVLNDRKGHSVLRKIKSRNGESSWEDRFFSPIIGSDGEVKYVIKSVRDITRIKTLERKFSDMQVLMDKMVQSSPSPIIAATRKGNVILMNHAAENLLGYSVEEAQSINIRKLYPEGVAGKIMKMLRDDRLGERGKLTATKVSVIAKSGEEIPVEMTAAIIYEDGREAATMGIFNDLREKIALDAKIREVQAQIVQSEKMASLGRLSAGVAHEINNPLTSILMYGHMMKEKLDPDHPLMYHLDCVLEDADRCKDIVRNLLAYSRQASAVKEPFDLNGLIDESLRLIRDQKLLMNISLVKHTAPRPIMILADKNQLRQVVVNLVMNAVDAIDQPGTITFRTYRHAEKDMACFEIQDTGHGIQKEMISKVFEPFFTTKKPGKGTGLGLSTVHGIVNENNGMISIKDTGPDGTTFLLELPILKGSPP